MAHKIDSKIKGFEVVKPGDSAAANESLTSPAPAGPSAIEMHEKIERPETLVGATYKVKSPGVEHALYVTINDIILNEGTADEKRLPFEIFVNSKNMEQFQWIVALTRIMSAVFRKGGDCTFLVEEMKAVFDPRGGYFKPGGVFMPSLIAEIGSVLERHLKSIGLLENDAVSPEVRQMLATKRSQYEASHGLSTQSVAADAATATVAAGDTFPAGATMCAKCSTKAVIVMDGCQTCLNCGNSKCN